MSKYAKAIAAIATPLVLVAIAKLAAAVGVDITVDEAQVNQAVVLLITTLSVYLVPNDPA
jgi:hypothetical protein